MSNFWKSFLCVLACIFLCVASFFTGYFFSDTLRIKQKDNFNTFNLSIAGIDNGVTSNNGVNVPFVSLDYLDFYLSRYNGVSLDSSFLGNINLPIRFTFYKNRISLRIGNYNNFSFDYGTSISVTNSYAISSFDYFGIGEYVRYDYDVDQNFDFSSISVFYLERVQTWDNDIWLSYSFVFYDTSGYMYRFRLFLLCEDLDYILDWTFSPIYFIVDGSAVSSNVYYQQGYESGYTDGFDNGKTTGYSSGYKNGITDGKSIGYQDGINATDSYSFSNLLTAVVEAPVNVFISLLDFNIMGYNLLSLVVGLLSLAVIVVIIKLCLGGK